MRVTAHERKINNLLLVTPHSMPRFRVGMAHVGHVELHAFLADDHRGLVKGAEELAGHVQPVDQPRLGRGLERRVVAVDGQGSPSRVGADDGSFDGHAGGELAAADGEDAGDGVEAGGRRRSREPHRRRVRYRVCWRVRGDDRLL